MRRVRLNGWRKVRGSHSMNRAPRGPECWGAGPAGKPHRSKQVKAVWATQEQSAGAGAAPPARFDCCVSTQSWMRPTDLAELHFFAPLHACSSSIDCGLRSLDQESLTNPTLSPPEPNHPIRGLWRSLGALSSAKFG